MPHRWLIVLAALALAGPARANPLDTYGFGARAIGMGGGFTAAASGTESLYYNVAGLADLEHPAATVGVLVSERSYRVHGAADRDEWLALAQLGLATPLPLGEAMARRLFLGLAISVPTSSLYDVVLPDDVTPAFPLIGDRDKRLVAALGLAARLTDWAEVGVGLTVLPDVRADVLVDLRQVGGVNETRIQVKPALAAMAGLKVRPLPWLAVGAAWRSAHHTRIDLSPVRVDVASNLDPFQAQITASTYSLPHEVALGVEARVTDAWTLAADVTWSHFGSWVVASPAVALCEGCPRDCSTGQCSPACAMGVCTSSFRDEAPPLSFRDTFAPRAGAEWHPVEGASVRAGYGFVPSPVPAQTGATSLIDGHRHVVSLGAGWAFLHLPAGWPQTIALDLHVQAQILPQVGWDKSTADGDDDGVPDLYHDPATGGAATWPTVRGSALLWAAGLDVRMGF
jgi:long-chain fatty acid transport protein